ncbi:hypothetical protein D3C85_787850 [compost metagenome]
MHTLGVIRGEVAHGSHDEVGQRLVIFQAARIVHGLAVGVGHDEDMPSIEVRQWLADFVAQAGQMALFQQAGPRASLTEGGGDQKDLIRPRLALIMQGIQRLGNNLRRLAGGG